MMEICLPANGWPLAVAWAPATGWQQAKISKVFSPLLPLWRSTRNLEDSAFFIWIDNIAQYSHVPACPFPMVATARGCHGDDRPSSTTGGVTTAFVRAGLADRWFQTAAPSAIAACCSCTNYRREQSIHFCLLFAVNVGKLRRPRTGQYSCIWIADSEFI